MGVRYEWADDRHFIMNVYIEFPWTWAEYNDTLNTTMSLIRDLKHPCATIINCSQMRSVPKGDNFLQILFNTEKAMPENLFASVVVAAPQVVTLFMNMTTKLRPRAQRLALFTHTMAEAQEKIYQRYAELYPT